ncbi:MAG TPA: phosphoribosylaminoimidazolesuccinocarboxamide synthase [Saprospiraceae bacterium]|nr:phosphoribosylaminoimidazolesuccinocarboxamide synthase [Saprospiraceae bacterium]
MTYFAPEQNCIDRTDFHFKHQKNLYHGKVRDVYDLGEHLLMITTDRISAFDCILPRPIPYKGQVLNLIAAHFLEKVKDIVPVWLQSLPDPNVSLGLKCEPIPIEFVVRGYLAGHAWRCYKKGESLCGLNFAPGLKESQKLDRPILSPTTKAAAGHDMDISYEQLIAQGIISKSLLDEIYAIAFSLFRRGTEMAAERDLILVDTKYEFGLVNGEIVLMDEIHTPDSSRYYIKTGYEERLANSEPQLQLSKEFVREWLMAHGFFGKEEDLMPEMPDSFVHEISERYLLLYEKLTGKKINTESAEVPIDRLRKNLSEFLI